MFYLVKVQYYSPYMDETLTQNSLLFAENLQAAAKIIEDDYRNPHGDDFIDSVTIYPVGEKGYPRIDINEEAANILQKEWIGECNNS